MKCAKGQIIAGKLDEAAPFQVFAVKGMSALLNGDRKVWINRWTPDDGDQPEDITLTFPGGEYSDGWRVLDFYDPAALVARAEVTIRLHRSLNDEELALAVLRAMFTGPQE